MKDNIVFFALTSLAGIVLGLVVRICLDSSASDRVQTRRPDITNLIGTRQSNSALPDFDTNELESIFYRGLVDSSTRARVAEMIGVWGEKDIVGLFRWWRDHDFRFLSATTPEPYRELLRKLAEADSAFAIEIAQSLRYHPTRFGELVREIARVAARSGVAKDYEQFLDEINALVNWSGLRNFGFGKNEFYRLLAEANPKEALSFIDSLQDPSEQLAAVQSMSSLSLEELLQELPRGRARDSAVTSLAYRAKRHGDLDLTVEALGALEDSHTRLKIAKTMARQLLSSLDVAGFEKLYQGLGSTADPEIAALENAVRFSKSADFDAIDSVLENVESSEIASTIRITVVDLLAKEDLDTAVNWIQRSGFSGLEKGDSLYRSAILRSSLDTDPLSVIEKVAQELPDLLPFTDVILDQVHEAQTAQSIFALLPTDQREAAISRWLDRYQRGLTSEQIAQIKTYLEPAPQ